MTVNHDHLKDTVNTWDGVTFKMMKAKEAKAAEKKGLLQIATNLSASQLKHAKDFKQEMEMPPGVVAPKSKKGYKTREMKAES